MKAPFASSFLIVLFWGAFFLSPAWGETYSQRNRNSEPEAVERLWEDEDYDFEGEEKFTFVAANPTQKALWSPDWWQIFEAKAFVWQTEMRSETDLETSFSSDSFDEDDLNYSRDEILYGGELRLGPAPLHVRLFYLRGEYTGRGTGDRSINYQGLNINQGDSFQSQLKFNDFFLDLNATGLYSLSPHGPSLTVRFYFGAGYFRLEEEITDDSSNSREERREALTWHYGIEGRFSPWNFLTFYGDLNYGTYRSSDLEVARMTQLRMRGGFQFNIDRYVHFGLEYRYHFYRLNKEGIIYSLETYGPLLFGSISF